MRKYLTILPILLFACLLVLLSAGCNIYDVQQQQQTVQDYPAHLPFHLGESFIPSQPNGELTGEEAAMGMKATTNSMEGGVMSTFGPYMLGGQKNHQVYVQIRVGDHQHINGIKISAPIVQGNDLHVDAQMCKDQLPTDAKATMTKSLISKDKLFTFVQYSSNSIAKIFPTSKGNVQVWEFSFNHVPTDCRLAIQNQPTI